MAESQNRKLSCHIYCALSGLEDFWYLIPKALPWARKYNPSGVTEPIELAKDKVNLRYELSSELILSFSLPERQ